MGQRLSTGLRALGAVALTLLCGCTGGGTEGSNPPPADRVDFVGVVKNWTDTPYSGAQVLFGTTVATTNAEGQFALPAVVPGLYNVSIQAAGDSSVPYQPFLSQQIQVATGASTVTFRLPFNDTSFRIDSVVPNLNETDVFLDRPVDLHFNSAIDPATVSAQDFVFTPDIGPLRVDTGQADSAQVVELSFQHQLPAGQNITLTVQGPILDIAGHPLITPVRLRFRTQATDESPPILINTTPAEGAIGFALNAALRFQFNEPLGTASPVVATSNPATTLSVLVVDDEVIVTNPAGWSPGTQYTVQLSGVEDVTGHPANPLVLGLNFTTGTQRAAVSNIQPEWNHARNAILFASNRLGDYDLYSINPDGTELTTLTAQPGDELQPTASADGALLAWQARDGGADWDVFVANYDQPGAAQALTSTGSNETEPVFARTSSRAIFFISDQFNETPLIYRMGPDGSNYGTLSPSFGNAQRDPAPHPLIDNQLLFATGRAGSLDIWSMSVSAIDDDVTTLNITDALGSDEHNPDWASDASFFAFISSQAGHDDLWTGDPSGFTRRVTNFDTAVADPSVSPFGGDNRCVASLANANGGSDLVIIDLVGGTILTNLTAEGGD